MTCRCAIDREREHIGLSPMHDDATIARLESTFNAFFAKY